MECFTTIQLSNDFICAPNTIKVAEELVRQSPLTFNFVSETINDPGSKAAPGAYASRIAAPIKTYQLTKMPDDSNPPQRSGPVKTFTLQMRPSQRKYAHRTEIRRNPIHFRWPTTPKEEQDSIFWALRDVVPDNIAREGLCDWHTGGQFSDDAQAMRISADHAELWNQYERQHKYDRPTNQTLIEGELVTWKSVVEKVPGFAAPAKGTVKGPNPDHMTRSEKFKTVSKHRHRTNSIQRVEETGAKDPWSILSQRAEPPASTLTLPDWGDEPSNKDVVPQDVETEQPTHSANLPMQASDIPERGENTAASLKSDER